METDEFGRLPLFPIDIREYHHFLTYQRLNHPETARELEWPGKDGFKEKGLDGNLHEAVLAVCLYHRRKMGYVARGSNPYNPFINEDMPSLQQYIQNHDFKDIDLMKVVPLMRLIDGCDIQARRAGSKEEVEITLKFLYRDHQTALDRSLMAVELWNEMFGNANDSLKQEFNGVNSAIKKQYHESEKLSSLSLGDKERKSRLFCLRKLHNAESTHEEKQLARLWLITAELINKAEMLRHQRLHYTKHQCVKEVLVIPANCFNLDNLSFNIALIENEGMAEYLNTPFEGGSTKTLRQLIEEEIVSEYDSIKDYKDHKLSITYRWNNENPFYLPGSKYNS